MKTFIRSILFIPLLMAALAANAADTLQYTGPDSNRIVITFMADGYKAEEMAQFRQQASTFTEYLFTKSPFNTYRQWFNIYALETASVESGAKHPGNAYDEGYFPVPTANPNNRFKSTFDYNGTHRLLGPLDLAGVSQMLYDSFPRFHIPILIVNSPIYGGSGGFVSTVSTHPQSADIVVHEIGHSFAGLADEYWTGFGQYFTPNVSPDNEVPWQRWLGTAGVGINPIGYSGWYRPTNDCIMIALGSPFCPVCKEAFVHKFHSLVNMVDSYYPSAQQFSVTVPVQRFSVKHLAGTTVNWYVNGVLTSHSDSILTNVLSGQNSVVAEVVDSTPLSRIQVYRNRVEWQVSRNFILSLDNIVRVPVDTVQCKIYSAAPGTVRVQITNPTIRNTSLQLYTLEGKPVLTREWRTRKVDMSYRVPSGLYISVIHSGGYQYTTKVFIN